MLQGNIRVAHVAGHAMASYLLFVKQIETTLIIMSGTHSSTFERCARATSEICLQYLGFPHAMCKVQTSISKNGLIPLCMSNPLENTSEICQG